MKIQDLNLFIVDDNKLMATGLRNYLDNKFGNNVRISTFFSGASALEKVDENTNVVILDYFLEGENGNEILDAIKKKNPQTEVIMLSSNENISVAVDSLVRGASNYIVKNETAWSKINSLLLDIISYPVKFLMEEFGVHKYLAIFLCVFVFMGSFLYYSLLVY